jgi:hypothetical protein
MSNPNYTAIYSVNSTDLPSLRIEDYIRIHVVMAKPCFKQKNNDKSQAENHIFRLRVTASSLPIKRNQNRPRAEYSTNIAISQTLF